MKVRDAEDEILKNENVKMQIKELEAQLAALRVESTASSSTTESPKWKKSKGELKKERKASQLDSTVGKELVPLPSRGNRFTALILETDKSDEKKNDELAATSKDYTERK